MGYTAARDRVCAKPHASAASNQGEAYEKTWDDAREGRVLLCFADAPGLEGMIASPQARVEKQSPDRILFGWGIRDGHDGPEYGKMLTPLRRREVARQVLWCWQARCGPLPPDPCLARQARCRGGQGGLQIHVAQSGGRTLWHLRPIYLEVGFSLLFFRGEKTRFWR